MTTQAVTINIRRIREDFPILKRRIYGKPLVYLDNAATSQKPRVVIEAIDRYYREYNANIHRGIHKLSEEATIAYEDARENVARFINARAPEEIVFTRNTTETINLVANAWGRQNIARDDIVLLTQMEHHSNIVPWLLLTKAVGSKIEYVDIDEEGFLKYPDFDRFLGPRTKIVALTHASNVLGTINPVKKIAADAHKRGAKVLLDAAQSVPHMPVDVQDLDCDFMAFSGHKMLGPTGIGVLYAKREILESMEPFLGGGEMIKEVHLHEATWKDIPYKFEAGTPNVVGAIGLGAAVDYLTGLGMENVREHEKKLTNYGLEEMRSVKGMTIYGPKSVDQRGGVIAFNLGDIHAHDLATILDEDGIAIRSGHHCAQPLMERLKIPATSRASFYIYNTESEVDLLVQALERARKLFKL